MDTINKKDAASIVNHIEKLRNLDDKTFKNLGKNSEIATTSSKVALEEIKDNWQTSIINQEENRLNNKTEYETDRTAEKNKSFPELLGEPRERKAASRTLATAANDSRRSQSDDERKKGFPKEKFLAHLEVSARQQGTWIDNVSSLGNKLANKGGAENEIYLSKDGKSFIKLNRFTMLDDKHGIEEFIDRLNSHNEFASNVPYDILGFAEDSEGNVCIVLKQPIVRGNWYKMD